MIRHSFLTTTLLLVILLVGACDGSKQKKETQRQTNLSLPKPPALISDRTERAGYMITHVFDNIEEIDTSAFTSIDRREQFLVDLIGIGMDAKEEDRRTSSQLFYRLATPAMDSIYFGLASKYFGEPNSPLYDEASYIIYTEEAEKIGLLTDAEKVRFAERKVLYNKNKVGERAIDFAFVLPNGQKRTLYGMSQAHLTLLVFYDPDCYSCQILLRQLDEDEVIKKAVGEGVQLLCIYPFENTEGWKQQLEEVPDFAIIGHNADSTISDESLYDLKAMPTLYLLDSDCKVILKDANYDEVRQYIINNTNNNTL